MKKKLVVAVVMSCVLAAGVVTGCGSKETTAPTTVTETTTAAEGETTTEAAEVSVGSDYATWTIKEWRAATDEEKTNATRYYLQAGVKATIESMGQEYTSDMDAAITDELIQSNISTIEMALSADENITLQEFLDLTIEAASEMVQ